MPKVIQLKVKDGELSLSRDMLREALLEDAVAAVVREHLILLKPPSLSIGKDAGCYQETTLLP